MIARLDPGQQCPTASRKTIQKQKVVEKTKEMIMVQKQKKI